MKHFTCQAVSVLVAGIALALSAAAQSSACGNTTPVNLWPPTHELTQYDIGTVTGVDDTIATVERITGDEALGTEGFDAVLLSVTTFEVRAERDGNGDGRVYHVIYSLNSTACDLWIGVPKSPNRSAIDSGVKWCIGTGC
jgi:hypothetical protein